MQELLQHLRLVEVHCLDISSTSDKGGYAEWFTGSCGGTSIGTGNSITVTPASTTTYYVRYTNSCGSTATCLSQQVTVNANLSVVSITPNGAQTICDADSGTLLTAAETDGGVITAHQWGKRSVSGGVITPISGATGSTYTPTGAGLTGGTWFIVCTSTPTCGTAKTSNEVTVSVSGLTIDYNTSGTGSFIVPAGVTSLQVECWGERRWRL